MSRREFLIVLAHTHNCGMCRAKMLADSAGLLARRSLTETERELLQGLKYEDFITPDTLSRAAQVSRAELEAFSGEAVVRLRHL
jgi:carbonic anhydrase